jgi:hypothetical protein
VIGNHEQLAIKVDEYTLLKKGGWLDHGGGWWFDLTSDQRAACRRAFARLPFVIEIETARGLVGIVHADVPAGMTWSELIGAVEACDGDTLGTLTWGEDRARGVVIDGVEGVFRVFCGHTPPGAGFARWAMCSASTPAEGASLDQPVAGVLNPEPVTLPTEAPVFDALLAMTCKDASHVLVSDTTEGPPRYVGVLSISQVR